jgi:uncharacterized protein (TIGR02996 family)
MPVAKLDACLRVLRNRRIAGAVRRMARLAPNVNQFGPQIHADFASASDPGTDNWDNYLALHSHDILADYLQDHDDPREDVVRRRSGLLDFYGKGYSFGPRETHTFPDQTEMTVHPISHPMEGPNFAYMVNWGGLAEHSEDNSKIPWYRAKFTPQELRNWLNRFDEDVRPRLPGITDEPEVGPREYARAASAVRRYALDGQSMVGFHGSIRANPTERTGHLAYADWLEERGHPLKAQVIRHAAQSENDRYWFEISPLSYRYPYAGDEEVNEPNRDPQSPGEFRTHWHSVASLHLHPEVVTVQQRSLADPDVTFEWRMDVPRGQGQRWADWINAEGRPEPDAESEQPDRLARLASAVRRYAATHPDERGFHHALAESPADKTNALVYADWLEEHGQPAHAEMIRRHNERDGGSWVVATDVTAINDLADPDVPWNTAITAGHLDHKGLRRLAVLSVRSMADPSRLLRWAAYTNNHDATDLVRRLHAEALQHAPEGGRVVLDHNASYMVRGVGGEEPLRHAAYRAPSGGMVARGTYYKGGSMVPDMEGAFMNPPAFHPEKLKEARKKWKAKKVKNVPGLAEPDRSDDNPTGTMVVSYARGVRKYAMGHSRELAALFRAARENPHEHTAHGVIADKLEELYPDSPIPNLIREQFGFATGEPKDNLWYEPVENSWDGTFPHTARLGQHGPFQLYLGHESPPYEPRDLAPGRMNTGSGNSRWILHAVSTLPGSRDFGYTFEFPHEEAHRIPQMFPAAASYIDSQRYPGFGSSEDRPAQGFSTYEGFRNHEARNFEDRMDAEERLRGEE